MSSITRSGKARHRARRLLPTLCAVAALGIIQPLHAASLHVAEREMLAQQAARSGGLMSVMVTIEELSLDAIRARGVESIRADVEQAAGALRAQLGNEVLEAGYWNNSMGQIGLIVTANGLRMLEQSAQVKDIQPDMTRNTRDRAWMTQEDRKAIEEALNTKGTVEIEVALNSDLDYQLGERGETLYDTSAEAAATQARSLGALTTSPASKSVQIVDDAMARAGASALVRVRVDWPAYYALRVAHEVRSIRFLGRGRSSSWPSEVTDTATKQDETEVIVVLHGSELYSPNEGYMSKTAWKNQSSAHRLVFEKMLAEAGADLNTQPHIDAGIGVMSVRLHSKVLNRIYAKKDPRIKEIRLNKPVASVSLNKSTSLMNMPSAWAAGYRAAGQFIFVLDTGTLRTHNFFRGANGASRIVSEACFGTNGALVLQNGSQIQYKSICPSQNSNGDSPIGLAGSAKPYSLTNSTYCNYGNNASTCSHGTHVTGIAAGRSHSSLTPSGIQGVAPDASIIPIQVFSYPSSSNSDGPNAFDADFLATLTATLAETVPGINPGVVNVSFGKPKYVYTGNCQSVHAGVAEKIYQLWSRGVPVVVAAGNDGFSGGISWPACVPKAIKVSAVINDAAGVTRAPYSNIANPDAYDGPLLLAPGGGVDLGPQSIRSSSSASDAAMAPNSGTSMAAPHVTGLYAAVKAVYPAASVDDITAMIKGSGGSIPVPVTWTSGLPPYQSFTYPYRRVRVAF